MPLCEHETRFNNAKEPGKREVCGRPAGVFIVSNGLAQLQTALCKTHLAIEVQRGRKFVVVTPLPES